MPEFTQLERAKSMIRYLPANGMAGLARLAVSSPSREPSPPARMTARVFIGLPSSEKVRLYLSLFQRLRVRSISGFQAQLGLMIGPCSLIKGEIVLSRSGPREMRRRAAHSPHLECAPAGGPAIHRQRPLERFNQVSRIIICKYETCSTPRN